MDGHTHAATARKQWPNDRAHSSAVAPPPLTPSHSHRPNPPHAHSAQKETLALSSTAGWPAQSASSLFSCPAATGTDPSTLDLVHSDIYTYTIIAVLRTAALVLVLVLLLRSACMHACMAALAS